MASVTIVTCLVRCVFACRDARIAALEMSCHDTERLIEESRTDRLKHLQEVYQAKMSTAELEAKYVIRSYLVLAL